MIDVQAISIYFPACRACCIWFHAQAPENELRKMRQTSMHWTRFRRQLAMKLLHRDCPMNSKKSIKIVVLGFKCHKINGNPPRDRREEEEEENFKSPSSLSSTKIHMAKHSHTKILFRPRIFHPNSAHFYRSVHHGKNILRLTFPLSFALSLFFFLKNRF